MKFNPFNITLLGLCFAALFALTGCTSTDEGGGNGNAAFYGPSADNAPNFTDQMRDNFRNNW